MTIGGQGDLKGLTCELPSLERTFAEREVEGLVLSHDSVKYIK